MNKVFGYARVSTIDQNLDTQIEALEKFGCNTIFQDKISGLSTQRLALGLQNQSGPNRNYKLTTN